MKIFKRFTAVLLTFTMLTTQGFAASMPLSLTPSAPEAVRPKVDLAALIDPQLAKVDEVFYGTSEKQVVLIQDPHCHYEGQRKEAELLEEVAQTFDFEAIYLEGAVGEINTDLFRSYPYVNVKQGVFDQALRDGTIGGAHYFSMMRSAPTFMHGIEDEQSYDANYEAAQRLLAARAEVMPIIHAYKEKMEILKNQIFSPQLKELDRILSEGAATQTLIQHLFTFIHTYDLDVSQFEAITAIQKYAAVGQALDPAEVDCDQLINDVKDFSDQLREMLLSSERQRRIDTAGQLLDLLEKGMAMEFVAADQRAFNRYRDAFDGDRLLRECVRGDIAASAKEIEIIRAAGTYVETFYRCVRQRDVTIAETFLAHMRTHAVKRAVLVAGGFHARSLKESLRKENVSFVSVYPDVAIDADARTLYLGKLSAPLSKHATLALRDAFENTQDVERLFSQLYFRHCSQVYEIPFAQFKRLIVRELRQLQLPTEYVTAIAPFDLKPLERQQQQQPYYVIPAQKSRTEAPVLSYVTDIVRNYDMTWPTPLAICAGMITDSGEIILAVNDIGVDEHAEMRLVLAVLDEAAKAQGNSTISVIVTNLRKLAVTQKILSNKKALKDLKRVNDELGRPLEGKAIYTSVAPCAECVRSLEVVGVTDVYYFVKPFKNGSGSIYFHEVDASHIPEMQEMYDVIRDRKDNQAGYYDFQALVRLYYAYYRSISPGSLPEFKRYINALVAKSSAANSFRNAANDLLAYVSDELVYGALKSYADDDLDTLRKGLVSISGGGGSQDTPQIDFHRLYGELSNMPIVAAVPADDDGGGTSKIQYFFKSKDFRLFAMGDSMNAYAGLSMRSSSDAKKVFPVLYNITRERIASNEQGAIIRSFRKAVVAQSGMLLEGGADAATWQRFLLFCEGVMVLLQTIDDLALFENPKNQSIGNMIWLGVAHNRIDIPQRMQAIASGKGEIVLTDAEVKDIQYDIARLFGIDDAIVVPSSNAPGTLYALLEDVMIGPIDDVLPLKGGVAHLAGKKIALTESISDSVDKENCHVFAEYDLAEGEEVDIYHVNKETPLNDYELFGTRIKNEKGTFVRTDYRVPCPPEGVRKEQEWDVNYLFADENIEKWHASYSAQVPQLNAQTSHVVEDVPRTVGVVTPHTKENDQEMWGAAVRKKDAGTLLISLARCGAATYIRRPELNKSIAIKNRIVVKQTNITESYHQSRIKKTGFANGHAATVSANAFLLESLRETQIGCLIRPGSQVTSILPTFLIPEVRDALKDLAHTQKRPVVWMMNPLTDNETVNATIESIIALHEESCGEPILYDEETGEGFVTDIIINNSELLPDEYKKYTTVGIEAKSHQRLAERARGILTFESAAGRDRLAKRVRIHDENFLLTTKAMEFRLSSEEKKNMETEYGLIFDSQKIRKILEPLFTQKNIEDLTRSDRFRTVETFFDNDADRLIEAIESRDDWQYIRVLENLHARLATLKRAQNDLPYSVPPRMIVMNLAHTVLATEFSRGKARDLKKVFSAEMRDAITAYLRSGGKIVFYSGNPFSELVYPFLFDEKIGLPEDVHAQVSTISLSGAELYQGTTMIQRTEKDIPKELATTIREICDVYSIPFDETLQKSNFVSLRLTKKDVDAPNLTSLSYHEILDINTTISADRGLTSDERNRYLLPLQPYGVKSTYDLRKHIAKLLEDALGESATVQIKGKTSIDIFVEDGGAVLKEVVKSHTARGELNDQDVLFVLANESLVNAAEKFPQGQKLAIPSLYPESVYVDGVVLPQESLPQNNWEHMEQRFIDLFTVSGNQLDQLSVERERFEYMLARPYNALVFDIDETLTSVFNGEVPDYFIDYFITQARAGVPIAFVTARTGSILVDGLTRKILDQVDDPAVLAQFYIYSGYGALGYRLSDINDRDRYLKNENEESLLPLTTAYFTEEETSKLRTYITATGRVISTLPHYDEYSLHQELDSKVVKKIYFNQDQGVALTPAALNEIKRSLLYASQMIKNYCAEQDILVRVSVSRRTLDIRPLRARKKWAFRHFKRMHRLRSSDIAVFGDNGKTDDGEMMVGDGSFCVEEYDPGNRHQVNVPLLTGKVREEATWHLLSQLRVEKKQAGKTVSEALRSELPTVDDEHADDVSAERTHGVQRSAGEQSKPSWYSASGRTDGESYLSDSLYVRQRYDAMRTQFNGDELHLVAAGGGGDMKGVLLAAYEQLKDFEGLGKKITKVKLFTSSLKRGEENPIGGPTPMEHIVYDDGGVLSAIEPAEGTQHFYPLKAETYFARGYLYDEKHLIQAAELYEIDRFQALKNPVMIDGKPVQSLQPLAENELVERFYGSDNFLKQHFPDLDIEIVIVDAAPSGDALATDYKKYIAGRETSVFKVCLDYGADILARFPEPIRKYSAIHPEYNVKSPNTDAVFLDMFAALENDFPDTTILGIGAMLGDGELGPVIFEYLRDLHDDAAIVGLLDRVRFYREQGALLSQIDNETSSIESEVSGNLFRWLQNAVNQNKLSFLDKYSPDYVGEPEVKALSGEDIFLRGESRVAWKVPHYMTMMYLSPNAVKKQIVDDVLREKSLSWYGVDTHIRLHYHYLTEMDDPNNVYSRLKVNLRMLVDVLMEKDAGGSYVVSPAELASLQQSTALLPRLAFFIAASRREEEKRDGYSVLLASLIDDAHREAVRSKHNPLFLGLMIHALKTLGITHDETRRMLFRIMLAPLEQPYTRYRGFDYWIIRREIVDALEFTGPELQVESKVLYDEHRDELVSHDQEGRREKIKELFLSLPRAEAATVWQSLIIRFNNEARLILESAPSVEELSYGKPEEGLAIFSYMHAARLFAVVSEMFAVISTSPFTNGGVVPKDIIDLMKVKQFKESTKRIMDIYSAGSMHPKQFYKMGYVAFRDYAAQLGYTVHVRPVDLMDEVDIYTALVDEARTLKHVWPIPKVVSGMQLYDGALITATNEIGVDEHAEMGLIFKVLRHALRLRQMSAEQRNAVQFRITTLEEKAKVAKVSQASDMSELLSIASAVGDPFLHQTVFVMMRPCDHCVEKLRLLGVKKVSYLQEHGRMAFRMLSEGMRGEMVLSQFEHEVAVPEESLLPVFNALVVQEGFDVLQDLVRYMYVYLYENDPQSLGLFRTVLDKSLGELSVESDVFSLTLNLLVATQDMFDADVFASDPRLAAEADSFFLLAESRSANDADLRQRVLVLEEQLIDGAKEESMLTEVVAREVSKERALHEYPSVVAIHDPALDAVFVDALEYYVSQGNRLHLFFDDVAALDEESVLFLLAVPGVTVHTAQNETRYAALEYAESFEGLVRQLPKEARVIGTFDVLKALSDLFDSEQLPLLFLARTEVGRADSSDAALLSLLPFAFMRQDELESSLLIERVQTKDSIPAFFQLNYGKYSGQDLIGIVTDAIREQVDQFILDRQIRIAA